MSTHYHVYLYKSDGSVKCQRTIWHPDRDQAEAALFSMLAGGSRRLDTGWQVDASLTPRILAEPRRASTGGDAPSYPAYRITKCDRKEIKCQAAEINGKAAAANKPRHHRRSGRHLAPTSYPVAAPVPQRLPYCERCATRHAPLETHLPQLTASEQATARLMGHAPSEAISPSAWYRTLAEAGHLDPRDDG